MSAVKHNPCRRLVGASGYHWPWLPRSSCCKCVVEELPDGLRRSLKRVLATEERRVPLRVLLGRPTTTVVFPFGARTSWLQCGN